MAQIYAPAGGIPAGRAADCAFLVMPAAAVLLVGSLAFV